MGKVLQEAVDTDVQAVQPVEVQYNAAYEDLMARQSVAALNQQLAAEGYDENSYGSDAFRSTMSQDLSGENQYPELNESGFSSSEQTFDQMQSGSYDASQNPGQGSVQQDASQLDFSNAGLSDQTNVSQQTTMYSNVFARFVGTIAEFVGSDTALGSKLKEMADNLDAGSSASVPDSGGVYHDLNDSNVLVEAEGTSEPAYSDPGGLSKDNIEFMSKKANRDFLNGEFLKAGQQSDTLAVDNMKETANSVCDSLTLDTVNNMVGVDAWEDNSPQKQDSAHKHMSVMRGLSAYHEEAASGIESAFTDDPERKETAMAGLRNMMSSCVPQVFATMYDNNKNFNFLSEADKAELNSMDFGGIGMNYGEYEAKRMEQDGISPEPVYADMQSDDAQMYANAALDEVVEVENAVTKGAASGAAVSFMADQAVEKQDVGLGATVGGVAMTNDPAGVLKGAVLGVAGTSADKTIQKGASSMTRADRIAIVDDMAASVKGNDSAEAGYGFGE